jgi:predicted RNA binding protein with dsRBD fold (UPF0201 family)
MIKVKYCGNCNPDVSPKRVKKALETLYTDIPREDISIMVNGCSRACLSKKNQHQAMDDNNIVLSARDVIKKKPVNAKCDMEENNSDLNSNIEKKLDPKIKRSRHLKG